MGWQPVQGVTESYLKPSSHTLSAFIAARDADLDARIRAALDNAAEAIAAMREPFASTSTDASMHNVNFAAIEACNDLVDVLDEAIEIISK